MFGVLPCRRRTVSLCYLHPSRRLRSSTTWYRITWRRDPPQNQHSQHTLHTAARGAMTTSLAATATRDVWRATRVSVPGLASQYLLPAVVKPATLHSCDAMCTIRCCSSTTSDDYSATLTVEEMAPDLSSPRSRYTPKAGCSFSPLMGPADSP